MNKKIFFLVLFFINTQLFSKKILEEAFVTFATANYFGILEVLIDSIHEFSNRPVIVYGVNATVPFSKERFPRMIKRRIDLKPGESVYDSKARVIMNCGIKFGVYLDADIVVNKNIDVLFDYTRMVEKFPLCSIHPQDPNDQQVAMDKMGVTEKSMPYIHTAYLVFSDKCMDIIREWYDVSLKYSRLVRHTDETMLNVVLWKHGNTQYLPVHEPFYEAINYYEQGKALPYFPIDWKVHCDMFHGCKDPKFAADILRRLKIFHKR